MCEVTPDAKVTFPKSLRSPALARDFVEEHTCEAHGGRAGVAIQLLASELVTNAVLYGSAPILVKISCSVYSMRIEVHEEDREEQDIGAVDDGLGLLLVDKVAQKWGTTPTPTGKTVWCTVPTGYLPQQSARPWQRTPASRTRPDVEATEAESGVRTPSH